MVREVRPPSLAQSPPQSRPTSSLGNSTSTSAASKLPVAGSRLPRPRTILKERTDQNKRPATSTAGVKPATKRKAARVAVNSTARSTTPNSRLSVERSLSPIATRSSQPATRGARVPAGGSPALTRPDDTMLWDIAPPSDMPSSSAFGDDNEPGPSSRTPRGHGVPGAGRLITPADSQEVLSASRKRPSTVTQSRTAKRRLPTPEPSQTLAGAAHDSPPPSSRIRPRDSLSPPLRLRSSRRRTDQDTSRREEETSHVSSPKRKRPRTSVDDISQQSAAAAPSTVKATRKVSTSKTPAADNSQGRNRAPPATAPAKGQERADRPRRLSTPMTFRLSATPITPSMRRDTTSFKRGLSPTKREILRGVFVGTSDIALQAEPGDDPILLMARRRAPLPKSTKRSNKKSARKSSTKKSQQQQKVIRVEDGDLAEYGDETVDHIPSDAYDGPEDTFAVALDRRNGAERGPPSMLGAQRLSAHLQALATDGAAEQEDLEQPANRHSPFVHRTERTKFSPSEGPGLSSLSRLVALDRAASPSGSEGTVRGRPSLAIAEGDVETEQLDDYDGGFDVHGMPSPSMSPEPFFHGAPTPDDSDVEQEQGQEHEQEPEAQAQEPEAEEPAVEEPPVIEERPSVASPSVQQLLEERRMAAARRTVSASPFSIAGSAGGLPTPMFTDEPSINGRSSPPSPTRTVTKPARSTSNTPQRDRDSSPVPVEQFSSRAASVASEHEDDRTARADDNFAVQPVQSPPTPTSHLKPLPSPEEAVDDSFDAEDDTVIIQEEDVQEDDTLEDADNSPLDVSSPIRHSPVPVEQPVPSPAHVSQTASSPPRESQVVPLPAAGDDDEETDNSDLFAEDADAVVATESQSPERPPVEQFQDEEQEPAVESPVHTAAVQQPAHDEGNTSEPEAETVQVSVSNVAHMSTLAAEFLDDISSDEEDDADEEHTAMLLEYSQEEVDPESSTIIVEDGSVELAPTEDAQEQPEDSTELVEIPPVVEVERVDLSVDEEAQPAIREPTPEGNESPAASPSKAPVSHKTALENGVHATRPAPLDSVDDLASASHAEESDTSDTRNDDDVEVSVNGGEQAIKSIVLVADVEVFGASAEGPIIFREDTAALEEEEEEINASADTIISGDDENQDMDVSAETVVSVSSEDDLDVSAATLEVDDKNSSFLLDSSQRDSGIEDNEAATRVNYTPPRYDIDEVVQAALGAGMVIDRSEASRQTTEQVTEAAEVVTTSEVVVQQTEPTPAAKSMAAPAPVLSPPTQTTPSEHQSPAVAEPELPLRFRRKMDAGSTPVRPRVSGASQHQPSPTPQNLVSPTPQHLVSPTTAAKQSPAVLLEDSPRRSPRLKRASSLEPAAAARSGRLSRGASPLGQPPSFVQESSPLKSHIELAPLREATPQRQATPPREPTPYREPTPRLSSPPEPALRGATPVEDMPTDPTQGGLFLIHGGLTPAPSFSRFAASPNAQQHKTTVPVESSPASTSLHTMVSRLALSPQKPHVSFSVFNAHLSPQVMSEAMAASRSKRFLNTPSPSPGPDVESPKSHAKGKGRATFQSTSPAAAATAAGPDANDADSDIGADDTIEGDSDAWNLTAADLTFDAQDVTANPHFAAHRFAGEAWDVTRIERNASAGPSAGHSATPVRSAIPSSPIRSERRQTRSMSAQPSPVAMPTPSILAEEPSREPSTRESRTPVPAATVRRSRTPVVNGHAAAPTRRSMQPQDTTQKTGRAEAAPVETQAGVVPYGDSDEDEGIARSEEGMGEGSSEEEDDGRILLTVVARGVVKIEPEDDAPVEQEASNELGVDAESREEEVAEPEINVTRASRTPSATPTQSRRLSSPIAIQRSPSTRSSVPRQPDVEAAQPRSPVHVPPKQQTLAPSRSLPSVLRYAPPSFQSPTFKPQLPIPQSQPQGSSYRSAEASTDTLGLEHTRHRRGPSISTRPAVPSALSHEIPLDSPNRSLHDELSGILDDEVEADDSFRSVVEVSSLDPRAAARAAAILKMNHRYIEHGILDSTPMASTSRLPETPFTTGERTEVYESMESELRKQRLLHDAELDIVLRDRSVRSMSAFTTASVTDSPLHIPGAWRRTPKRKRHVEESPPQPREEVVAIGGRPWRGKDWRRLHRVYRSERAKWVSERAIRPLPSTASGSWSFRQAPVEPVPWDRMRVVDAFIKARGLKEDELVGEWSRNVIANRVTGIEARFGVKEDEDRSEPTAKRARVDPHPAPPSTVKRILNWVWGFSTKPTEMKRTVSAELERAERGESRSPHFLQRTDDTVDFDVTMATPSRQAVASRLEQQTRNIPDPRPVKTRPMRQLPNIARVADDTPRARSRSRQSPSGRSPSAPALRSPSPEGTQLDPDEYRYNDTSSRLYPPLYPGLPDRSAALSNRSFASTRTDKADRTFAFDRSTISGTPGPKPKLRVRSAPGPQSRSRDPPNVRNLVRGFEETSRLDLSFESERREREKERLRSLRRVSSSVEQLRDRDLSFGSSFG